MARWNLTEKKLKLNQFCAAFVKKVIAVSSTILKMTVRITFMEDAKIHGEKPNIGQYVSIG